MAAICTRNMQEHQTQLCNQLGIDLGAGGNKRSFTLFRRISYFTQGLRTAAPHHPPPFHGSHNRTATNPFSNHVIASMSSGCTQGTKYVLFGQPPYRSAYTTRHSAGAQFKTINIYSTIFKSLIKYPNKPWSNDVHACRINVNKQSSITVWVLILVLQSKYVCLSVCPSNGARTDLDYKIRVQTHNVYHNKS
jgi:hypothetical protein